MGGFGKLKTSIFIPRYFQPGKYQNSTENEDEGFLVSCNVHTVIRIIVDASYGIRYTYTGN